MLEQGIVMLIAASSSPPTTAGGFFAELPKDYSLAVPAWTYRTISDIAGATLTTFKGMSTRRLQIDCYGEDAADVINLANTINNVLHGYQGTLPDPGATLVSACFQSDMMDFFDDARRSFRRMLEYEILYMQN